jgi:hypothetical protein
MQGINNYIPETNHVSRANSVAGVLYLQFMVSAMFIIIIISSSSSSSTVFVLYLYLCSGFIVCICAVMTAYYYY